MDYEHTCYLEDEHIQKLTFDRLFSSSHTPKLEARAALLVIVALKAWGAAPADSVSETSTSSRASMSRTSAHTAGATSPGHSAQAEGGEGSKVGMTIEIAARIVTGSLQSGKSRGFGRVPYAANERGGPSICTARQDSSVGRATAPKRRGARRPPSKIIPSFDYDPPLTSGSPDRFLYLSIRPSASVASRRFPGGSAPATRGSPCREPGA